MKRTMLFLIFITQWYFVAYAHNDGAQEKFNPIDYVPSFVLEWGQGAYEWLFDVKKALKNHLVAFTENPYKEVSATVRIGNELCEGERLYRANRKVKVKNTLKKILGYEIADEEVPTIALVCSGGGYRAAISMLGFLLGAEKNSVLDMSTYLTGISGSCWMIGSWISSGLSLDQYKESMVKKMCQGLTHVGPKGALLMADMLLVKYAADQPITLVDFYGALLGHALFRDQKECRHRMYLSKQVERIQDGNCVFPIYLAVSGDEETALKWYEFTPYEMGAHWLNAYIPVWAYGREFKNGISIDDDPEQSLGYLFGVFGSAFSASFSRIYAEFKENIHFSITKYIIEKVLEKVGNKRLTAAKIHNFTYGMENSPIKDKNKLRFVDAGLAINLGYQPVSGQRPERKADIMIMLEASADVSQANSLRGVERYAQENNLPFPHIDYTTINTKAVTVFVDHDNTDTPIIIYMPLINDAELWNAYKNDPQFIEFNQYLNNFDPIDCIENTYCSTFDFTYEDFELRQLSALTEFNMRASAQSIYDVIRLAVERKKM